MKNAIKLIGIIALVAMVGFTMVSCGGDDDPTVGGGETGSTGGTGGTGGSTGGGGGTEGIGNSFEGSWNNGTVQLILSGNTWTRKEDGTNNSKGTFSINENTKTVTFVFTHIWSNSNWVERSSQTFTANYNLNGNTLVLSNSNHNGINGTWTKQ